MGSVRCVVVGVWGPVPFRYWYCTAVLHCAAPYYHTNSLILSLASSLLVWCCIWYHCISLWTSLVRARSSHLLTSLLCPVLSCGRHVVVVVLLLIHLNDIYYGTFVHFISILPSSNYLILQLIYIISSIECLIRGSSSLLHFLLPYIWFLITSISAVVIVIVIITFVLLWLSDWLWYRHRCPRRFQLQLDSWIIVDIQYVLVNVSTEMILLYWFLYVNIIPNFWVNDIHHRC